MKLTNEIILQKLVTVILPEVNVPLTNFIKELNVSDNQISVHIELDKRVAALQSSLEKVVKNLLSDYVSSGYKLDLKIEGEKVQMHNVKINKDAVENPLENVKNIIAVASGKGGVGKSTVSANLAIALANLGYKVGLLDADVYGPSIPLMFGVTEEHPEIERIDNKDFIIPIEKYGVKLISIGFFVKEEDALIWRGAMATSAVKQLINEVAWGDLDYFVIDMPPGTGDVPLTMVQTLPLTGALVVTTPQQVAVADVMKSITMFKSNKIEVPVLGLIENMSWFTPSDMPDKKYLIFGQGGAENLSKKFNIPVLGQIPIDENVVPNADKGKPIILDEKSPISKAFMQVAQNTVERVIERNKNLPPTQILKITH